MELFVYGTLMVPQVMRGVCGYTDVGTPSELNGYRCRLVRGEVYPAIVPQNGEQVTGLLYRGVTARQTRLLDAFEGECYDRRLVTVSVQGELVRADTYVLHEYFIDLLSDRHWSLEAFRSEGIHRFTRAYRGFDRAAQGSQSDD